MQQKVFYSKLLIRKSVLTIWHCVQDSSW